MNKFGVIGKTKCWFDGIWLGCSLREWGWFSQHPFSTKREKCSPQVWGWFHVRWFQRSRSLVFPASVGVILWILNSFDLIISVPHGCGDGPLALSFFVIEFVVFPTVVWGLFHAELAKCRRRTAFPTDVRVILKLACLFKQPISIPHGCGGDSFYPQTG